MCPFRFSVITFCARQSIQAFFVFMLVTTFVLPAFAGGEDYDAEIEAILASFSAEHQTCLRPILIRWRDEKSPMYTDHTLDEKRSFLTEIIESQVSLPDGSLMMPSPKVKEAVSKSGTEKKDLISRYNLIEYQFGAEPNTRHFGLTAFDDGYSVLFRMRAPNGFLLRYPSTQALIGRPLPTGVKESVKQDRNRIYDLLASELPAGYLFRVQDVYQRNSQYLFVHAELPSTDQEVAPFLTSALVDKVYRRFAFTTSEHSLSLDMVGGKTAKIRHLHEHWDKETSYLAISRALTDENPFAAIEFEISAPLNTSEAAVVEQLTDILINSQDYDKHPLVQFYRSSAKNIENVVVRVQPRATRELVEALYRSDYVTNITPTY